tara:strand:+ start:552 stop:719 length:168 start_codon:yes stop_codon:yes gene_type:complete
MGMKKTLISCAHCGGMFQVEHSDSATGSKTARHSKCGKESRLRYNRGEISGTEKS